MGSRDPLEFSSTGARLNGRTLSTSSSWVATTVPLWFSNGDRIVAAVVVSNPLSCQAIRHYAPIAASLSDVYPSGMHNYLRLWFYFDSRPDTLPVAPAGGAASGGTPGFKTPRGLPGMGAARRPADEPPSRSRADLNPETREPWYPDFDRCFRTYVPLFDLEGGSAARRGTALRRRAPRHESVSGQSGSGPSEVPREAPKGPGRRKRSMLGSVGPPIGGSAASRLPVGWPVGIPRGWRDPGPALGSPRKRTPLPLVPKTAGGKPKD